MLQRSHILLATARKGQVGDLVALVFPVLGRDGVEGGVFRCENEAWGGLGPGEFHCVYGVFLWEQLMGIGGCGDV